MFPSDLLANCLIIIQKLGDDEELKPFVEQATVAMKHINNTMHRRVIGKDHHRLKLLVGELEQAVTDHDVANMQRLQVESLKQRQLLRQRVKMWTMRTQLVMDGQRYKTVLRKKKI